MTVEKTIGSGGDFADIGLAWAWLVTLGTLADDYEFSIINDFIETTFVNTWIPFNNHVVSFLNPDKYTITVNAVTVNVYSMFACAPSPSLASTLVIDGLIIDVNSYLTANILSCRFAGTAEYLTVVIKNVIIRGSISGYYSQNLAIQLHSSMPAYWPGYTSYYIYNCKVSNCGAGIWNTATSEHWIENCSFYHCGYGVALTGSNPTWTHQVKNVVAIDSITKDFNGGGAQTVISNCADSDNTIITCTGALTDNITGVTAADFLSVDPDDDDSLEIDQTSKLFATGTTPSIAENTADIDGNPRPNALGQVSIGIHEPVIPTGDSILDLAECGTEEIFRIGPDWKVQPKMEMQYGREVIQYDSATTRYRYLTNDLGWKVEAEFFNVTKDIEYEILNFFLQREGRLGKFWLPVWEKYFAINSAGSEHIEAGSKYLYLLDTNVPYETSFNTVFRGYERLFILLKNGNLITRKIKALISGHKYEIESAWDREILPEDIEMFGKLILCRFDQDTIDMRYDTTDLSTCQLSFQELAKEYV